VYKRDRGAASSIMIPAGGPCKSDDGGDTGALHNVADSKSRPVEQRRPRVQYYERVGHWGSTSRYRSWEPTSS